MGRTLFFDWEVSLMHAMQASGNIVLEKLAVLFTMLGEDALMLFAVGLFFWGFNKRIGKNIGLYFLTSILAGCMIKNVVLRRRPYMDHESIRCLKPVSNEGPIDDIGIQGYSCPSLHANDTMTIYGTLMTYAKKKLIKVLIVCVIAVVGISRVYLGVHYPTDVLAGWICGIFFIILMRYLQTKIKNDAILALLIAIAAFPGWFFCKSTDFYTGYGLLIGMNLGFWLDEKYIKFKNTSNILVAVIRAIVGVLFFSILSMLLKKPFPAELLEGQTFAAHLIRTARYAIGAFAAMAIYPMTFKMFEKDRK